MMHVGGYHEYHGVFSTAGDIMFCNLSTMWDSMIRVGDTISTVGVFSTVEVLK